MSRMELLNPKKLNSQFFGDVSVLFFKEAEVFGSHIPTVVEDCFPHILNNTDFFCVVACLSVSLA